MPGPETNARRYYYTRPFRFNLKLARIRTDCNSFVDTTTSAQNLRLFPLAFFKALHAMPQILALGKPVSSRASARGDQVGDSPIAPFSIGRCRLARGGRGRYVDPARRFLEPELRSERGRGAGLTGPGAAHRVRLHVVGGNRVVVAAREGATDGVALDLRCGIFDGDPVGGS